MTDRYKGLRDAIAAVGPVRWHSPGLGEVHDSEHTTIAQCVGTEWSDERQEHYPGLTQGQPVADYIAAADPASIAALLKERDALLAIHSDTLLAVRNDTLETAALICDARERRAEASQAQACYRLMAKDIRALKRAAASEPPAQEPGTAAEIEALRAECERLRADAGGDDE